VQPPRGLALADPDDRDVAEALVGSLHALDANAIVGATG
jgi:hypothetical protein